MRTQRWTAVRTGEVTPDTDLLGEGEEIAGANPGIDAGGLPALPGIVDPYPGFQLDTGRARIVDDLESASMAAAAGGATTCIGFAARLPDQRPPAPGSGGDEGQRAAPTSTSAPTSGWPSGTRAGSVTWSGCSKRR
jgi:hypothetical protein